MNFCVHTCICKTCSTIYKENCIHIKPKTFDSYGKWKNTTESSSSKKKKINLHYNIFLGTTNDTNTIRNPK